MTGSDRDVVFVTQRFPPDKGGNAARIHDIAVHLNDQEWDVRVLAPPPSYPPGEFERSWDRKQTDTIEDVTVHRLWTWQPQGEDPSMVKRLAYYLCFGIHAMVWLLWNVRQYDAVVTTTPPISTGAPGLLAATLGKPWIVDVRDLWIDASISLDYLEAGSLLERVSRRFQRLVLSTADRIAITTESLGESLQENYGESLKGKLILIPNGVDVERFQSAAEAEKLLTGTAASSSISETEPTETGRTRPDGGATLIYTGNLGSAQDLESCIRAMGHLTNERATLRLVGTGDRESELRRLTDELGLRDRVEFTGLVPREEVPALLREATIGIAPLRDTEELSYAMPTKVYEYMASGLPTVVTGRGEVKHFIEVSGGGVHVENDPEEIAALLDELLADEKRLRLFAEQGRAHVEQNYDREEISRRLATELSRLVESDSQL